ncbi:GNAT family N-acetyltransferase [Nocardioides sp.]|uniref:GNAT family N-acetyltransferase n=1 Tax=Nocardioides sp. TaxID=35761 RepID=UPI00352795A5
MNAAVDDPPAPPEPGTEWVIRQLPITHPDAALLVAEVQAEYVVRYGGPDSTPLQPHMFDPPAGAFFVVYDPARDDSGAGSGMRPVATGAWRRRTDVEAFGSTDAAEVKRMFVTASHRGRGLGHVVLAHLEATARDAGAEVMILETGTAQPEAMGLYESAGYTSIPGFGHYAWSPKNRCYAKPLR